MSWFRPLFALILTAILSATTAAQNSSRFDVKRMDTTCKPCEDFYQFVNRTWLKETQIPPAYSSWGTFQILTEDNRQSCARSWRMPRKATPLRGRMNRRSARSLPRASMNLESKRSVPGPLPTIWRGSTGSTM